MLKISHCSFLMFPHSIIISLQCSTSSTNTRASFLIDSLKAELTLFELLIRRSRDSMRDTQRLAYDEHHELHGPNWQGDLTDLPRNTERAMGISRSFLGYRNGSPVLLLYEFSQWKRWSLQHAATYQGLSRLLRRSAARKFKRIGFALPSNTRMHNSKISTSQHE